MGGTTHRMGIYDIGCNEIHQYIHNQQYHTWVCPNMEYTVYPKIAKLQFLMWIGGSLCSDKPM